MWTFFSFVEFWVNSARSGNEADVAEIKVCQQEEIRGNGKQKGSRGTEPA